LKYFKNSLLFRKNFYFCILKKKKKKKKKKTLSFSFHVLQRCHLESFPSMYYKGVIWNLG
jgi:hypothetical protein